MGISSLANKTMFDMVFDIIVALENCHLKRSPICCVEQQKAVAASWPKKDKERRKQREEEEDDGDVAIVEVRYIALDGDLQ